MNATLGFPAAGQSLARHRQGSLVQPADSLLVPVTVTAVTATRSRGVSGLRFRTGPKLHVGPIDTNGRSDSTDANGISIWPSPRVATVCVVSIPIVLACACATPAGERVRVVAAIGPSESVMRGRPAAALRYGPASLSPGAAGQRVKRLDQLRRRDLIKRQLATTMSSRGSRTNGKGAARDAAAGHPSPDERRYACSRESACVHSAGATLACCVRLAAPSAVDITMAVRPGRVYARQAGCGAATKRPARPQIRPHRALVSLEGSRVAAARLPHPLTVIAEPAGPARLSRVAEGGPARVLGWPSADLGRSCLSRSRSGRWVRRLARVQISTVQRALAAPSRPRSGHRTRSRTHGDPRSPLTVSPDTDARERAMVAACGCMHLLHPRAGARSRTGRVHARGDGVLANAHRCSLASGGVYATHASHARAPAPGARVRARGVTSAGPAAARPLAHS
jgi:hypothetical protein